MEATATRPDLTLTMPVHPALAGRDDITVFLTEVLDDSLDDYLNLRETAYVGYRNSGHDHTSASGWAHDAARHVLPRGATLTGGNGL